LNANGIPGAAEQVGIPRVTIRSAIADLQGALGQARDA